MPRIRTLKPEHRQHRKVGALDHISYRLWVGMILEADDEGRLVYDPEALRVLIFGYDVKVSRAIVERSTNVLARVGLVNIYRVNEQDYVCFPSWHDHQKIDRKRPSLLPSCEASSSDRRALDDHSSLIGKDLDLEGKGSDRKGSPDPGANGAPPPARTNAWHHIPSFIAESLSRAPRLSADRRLQQPAWWQAHYRVNPAVDYGAEVLKAEAWLVANPTKAPKGKDLSRFLHNWLGRATPAEA